MKFSMTLLALLTISATGCDFVADEVRSMCEFNRITRDAHDATVEQTEARMNWVADRIVSDVTGGSTENSEARLERANQAAERAWDEARPKIQELRDRRGW